MATIVITSEEDPSLTVVRFQSELSWADAGPEVLAEEVSVLCREAETCIANGQNLELVSLMLTPADLIFPKLSEKDLECIFTVICNLVTKATSLNEELEMAERISVKVCQQPNDKPALRLKILFNLYNLLANPYSKFYVYMKALHLAVGGKVTENIIPSFKKMDSFLKEWNIRTVDQRKLFLTISNVLKENKSMSKDSFNFLTKYLATFSSEDANIMSEAKGEAVRAVMEFVKAPDMFQCDLLDMPAVAQLEQDGNYAWVYQLLKIFLTRRLKAYTDFQAENDTAMTEAGLVFEDCMTKMRLLSLADLGSNESGGIPYAMVANTLMIQDDEVEEWIVKAIAAKLLDCKMDQLNQTVIVSRCSDRLFGPNQWVALRSKLSMWRGNIANVITTIQANKLVEDASQVTAQGVA
ncbi:hypothetical protein C5167_005775 [Papaver somniferum]|uniref:Eukaryotic translation initiation factor 3 subunit M n=1 Tax=Papaver somniferum TaxID=3469 RepID=A0A4Y7JEK9_PAPSO|nr:eukaryotic translation initiation factor 3 subunit M-like isoform X1 [Papaver somniferum]XP_026381137.1 eukaryotic translation initiation factor 3 subunit M-like isoform X2 [Papaver somniferum]RZC58482.1 hypothetical protein C5167_005775 [Papaver somniferum]